jgi:hypothetical protein
MKENRARSMEQRAREKEHILSLRGKAPSPVIARSETPHLSLRGTKSRSNLIGSGQAPQSQDSLGTGSTISKNEIPRGVYPEQKDEILRYAQNDKGRRAQNEKLQVLSNEKGIALVMILILAAIALAIMAGLIYMVTSSSQISGMQKRYKTALEGGVGGADVFYQFISLRGDPTDTLSLQNVFLTITPTITTAGGVSGPGGCSGTDVSGKTFYGFEAKLKTPSTSWSAACDPDNMSIIPSTPTSYDMQFDIGTSPYPTYRVYAKIASTVEGNSAVDRGLLGRGVVASGSGSGEVTVMSVPYLYTVEMDAQNPANPSERAKLSILYQY